MGVRKDQNTLTAAEKARFIAALKKMKTDTAAAYNYNKYPTIHNNAFGGDMNDNPAHMGPAFFPWHRYFLRRLERDLEAADRALGNDGNVTLPYWDWTHDNADEPNKQRGSIWKDDFMGGYGNPVTSGPLRDGQWPVVTFPGHPPKLSRALGRKSLDANTMSGLPIDEQVREALKLEGFDCPPWSLSSPAGPALAAPPAPRLTGATGGTLPPGIYRVAVTYLNITLGETRASQEATICLGGACTPANSNNAISVASPPAAVAATWYKIYVSTAGGAPGSATLQGGTRSIGTATAITALAAGDAMPTLNSTGSFRNVVEGWTVPTVPQQHNRVHVWVGGSMAPGSSPNDPIFFLHHCNIDRLWALWQFRHPGQNYPLVVPKVGVAGNRPHGLNDLMPFGPMMPEEVRPIDVLNHQTMGYSYDTDPVGMSVNLTP